MILQEKEKEIVKPAGAVFGSSSSVFGSSSSLFGSTWGLLVHCLAQFVTAEKAYMSLSFLEQKGFFHRSKDVGIYLYIKDVWESHHMVFISGYYGYHLVYKESQSRKVGSYDQLYDIDCVLMCHSQ